MSSCKDTLDPMTDEPPQIFVHVLYSDDEKDFKKVTDLPCVGQQSHKDWAAPGSRAKIPNNYVLPTTDFLRRAVLSALPPGDIHQKIYRYKPRQGGNMTKYTAAQVSEDILQRFQKRFARESPNQAGEYDRVLLIDGDSPGSVCIRLSPESSTAAPTASSQQAAQSPDSTARESTPVDSGWRHPIWFDVKCTFDPTLGDESWQPPETNITWPMETDTHSNAEMSGAPAHWYSPRHEYLAKTIRALQVWSRPEARGSRFLGGDRAHEAERMATSIISKMLTGGANEESGHQVAIVPTGQTEAAFWLKLCPRPCGIAEAKANEQRRTSALAGIICEVTENDIEYSLANDGSISGRYVEGASASYVFSDPAQFEIREEEYSEVRNTRPHVLTIKALDQFAAMLMGHNPSAYEGGRAVYTIAPRARSGGVMVSRNEWAESAHAAIDWSNLNERSEDILLSRISATDPLDPPHSFYSSQYRLRFMSDA